MVLQIDIQDRCELKPLQLHCVTRSLQEDEYLCVNHSWFEAGAGFLLEKSTHSWID